ncbi:uncharacterized protein LOC135226578 isoform X1 [Macrobrachium nipponense]|uniref:uncharacterized protein LOC135226578 isoform X1 n=2 Tax=Macrobrachium nipponense TaxID=159736 RepID=UPI0030C7E101
MTSLVAQGANNVVPSYHRPPCLSSLAATFVARSLIYEDYYECNHYRWDPVIIWQYELPQRKKKNKKAVDRTQLYTEASMPIPQPPWKEMKKFRDWWWNNSTLGSFDSALRCRIIDAIERLSWTSATEEEYVLFLLLRLCVDTRIEIGNRFQIAREWCFDLSQVISQLGPFPVQKLFVTYDALGIKPVLTALVQQSPHLQVLKVNQWALSNDFMMTIGCHCHLLSEFAIPFMQPQVFMSDEALFFCFFDGMSSEEVIQCWKNGTKPRRSFYHLKYIDILYWKQTERFIQMVSVFYPEVRLGGIDAYCDVNEKENLIQPFLDVNAQVTALRVSCRTSGILDDRLTNLASRAPFLRELRIHVDDSFEGADCDSIYEKRLEEAGAKLKELVSQISAFDSLALRPHPGVDITKVVLPTLHAQGSCITSLQLCYEYAQVNSNTLFQIINLCPRLYRLVVSMVLLDSDEASTSYRTLLQPCNTLHTFVMRDIASESDESQDSCYAKIASQILHAAPNLEMFGLSYEADMVEEFRCLSSSTVRTLHLQFCSEVSLGRLHILLQRTLPNFPNLRTLSLDVKEGVMQFEGLACVCHTGINVTQRKPEFFQLPKWDSSRGSQNNFALYVM